MARQFAQLKTSIWKIGSDYRDLTAMEQWFYELLISQPDLTNAGTIIFRPARWAAMAADADATLIHDLAASLVAKRYLILDVETDEVMVRTFIRHDVGNGNWKLRKATQAAIGRIESDRLRGLAQAEFAALPAIAKKGDPPSDDPEGQSIGDRSAIEGQSIGDGIADRLPIAPTVNGQLSTSNEQLPTDNLQPSTSSSSETRLKLVASRPLDDDEEFNNALNLVVEAKAAKYRPDNRIAWEQTTRPETVTTSGEAIRERLRRGETPFDIATALVGKVYARMAANGLAS